MQYLHPVRMYIFISLVFFILLFKYTEKKEKQTPEAVKKEVKTNNANIYKSFRNVYHRSRFRKITKMIGVGASYSVAVILSVCVMAIFSFISM